MIMTIWALELTRTDRLAYLDSSDLPYDRFMHCRLSGNIRTDE